MITELVRTAFSSIVDYYDEYMAKTEHAKAQRKMARLIAQRVNDGLVLDVATGTGIMLEPFQDGIGLDISSEMVEVAKAKYNKEFLVADVHYLPFRDKVFEATLSCLAFLWFENPEQALKEMVRVARKVYVIEEEGVPARKRIEIPPSLEIFFSDIERLEKEVYIESLDTYQSCPKHQRVGEVDIDGLHKFVCWEIAGTGFVMGGESSGTS